MPQGSVEKDVKKDKGRDKNLCRGKRTDQFYINTATACIPAKQIRRLVCGVVP